MYSTTTMGWRGTLVNTAVATVFVAGAAAGVTLPANSAPTGTGLLAMSDDPGCDAFGWRHPMCAGGAWEDDESASQEWGPADVPNPVSPNVDGSITFPGSPGMSGMA